MNWIRDRKHRIYISVAAGLLGAALISTIPEKTTAFLQEKGVEEQICAWWGWLYPRFCFSEKKYEKVKISFWLAQALDW